MTAGVVFLYAPMLERRGDGDCSRFEYNSRMDFEPQVSKQS